MAIDLDGHTAIVTGSGRGIGREIALTLAKAGADVALAARTESEIEAVAEQAADHGVESIAIPTDLSQVSEIDALVDQTIEQLGKPTILVNNAAANLPGDPAEQPLEEIDTMMNVNFRAVFLLSVRFAEEFRDSEHDAGRIITISSITGPRGNPSMIVYGGTKTGVYGLSRGLAAEYAEDGITSNTVSPVTTRSERVEHVLEEKDLHDLDGVPVGRWGQPEDVANVCLCVASDHFGFVTGEDIRVDGGAGVTSRHRKG